MCCVCILCNVLLDGVCTVCAQGAISLEHKAKQAVGGVQLVRLSFPPVCDIDAITKIIGDSVASLYK